jgi:hypothetical protein
MVSSMRHRQVARRPVEGGRALSRPVFGARRREALEGVEGVVLGQARRPRARCRSGSWRRRRARRIPPCRRAGGACCAPSTRARTCGPCRCVPAVGRGVPDVPEGRLVLPHQVLVVDLEAGAQAAFHVEVLVERVVACPSGRRWLPAAMSRRASASSVRPGAEGRGSAAACAGETVWRVSLAEHGGQPRARQIASWQEYHAGGRPRAAMSRPKRLCLRRELRCCGRHQMSPRHRGPGWQRYRAKFPKAPFAHVHRVRTVQRSPCRAGRRAPASR